MINKGTKIWVHIRFFLKFVPFQLLTLTTTYWGALFFLILALWLKVSWLFFIISILALPLAIFEEKVVKTRLFAFLRDDTRFNPWRPSGYEKDYENFLDGRKESWLLLYLWYNRNRWWNALVWMNGKKGDEYLVELIKNELLLRGEPVTLTNDHGLIPHENVAGLKWITKEGREDWWTFRGEKISFLYSIFGEAAYYYRIRTRLYYRYSKCVQLRGFWLWFWRIILLFTFKWLFKRDLWFTLKYNPNQDIGVLHFKVQWEKD